MITATLPDGTKQEIPPGSNTLGARFRCVEIDTAQDILGARDWFFTSVLTRLIPVTKER